MHHVDVYVAGVVDEAGRGRLERELALEAPTRRVARVVLMGYSVRRTQPAVHAHSCAFDVCAAHGVWRRATLEPGEADSLPANLERALARATGRLFGVDVAERGRLRVRSADGAALAVRFVEPVLHLPMPYLVSAPCARCGALVSIGRPIESGLERIVCKACPTVPQFGPGSLQVITEVRATDAVRDRACRKVGLPPGAVFQVEDLQRRTTEVVRLRGGPADLFSTVGPRDKGDADQPGDDATAGGAGEA